MMDNHYDVRFRGKAIDDLTRDEAIAALKQALSHVKAIEQRGIPTIFEDELSSGGVGAVLRGIDNAPYVRVIKRSDLW